MRKEIGRVVIRPKDAKTGREQDCMYVQTFVCSNKTETELRMKMIEEKKDCRVPYTRVKTKQDDTRLSRVGFG